MAIHVRELLELPHLALELIAGREGVDAVVRWSHVSEVEDPTPWLEGGELILTTGVGLPREARAQGAYLRRLARAGAAGLVIVEDSAPPLAPTLRTTAERLAFPLIKTSLKQPFRAIAEVVVAANATADSQRLVDHMRIYGVLRAATSDGAGPHNVLARLGDLTAMRLAVVRDDGHPQFGPGPPHPRWEEATRVLAAAGGRHPRRGAYARLDGHDGSPGGYVIQLDAAAPSRVFLVAEGVEPSSTPDLVAVHHIATIMAATVLSQRAERAVEQKLGAQLLRELIAGDVADRRARERLRTLGVPAAALVALVVGVEPAQREQLADALHDGLLDRDMPALVGDDGSQLVVVAPSPGTPEELALATLELVVATLGEPCPIGAGSVGPLAHVQASYREAGLALPYAESADPSVASFERLEAPLAWLPSEPERIALLVERTIGPLLAYDREHRSDLLRTLRAYLGANRSPSVAARALHLHRNTLAYRLRKIEALTGRSLGTMDDGVELWLGLRAHEVAGGGVA